MTLTHDKEPGGSASKVKEVDRTPEEFSFETRYVVLNYFGFLPSANLDDAHMLSLSSASSHRSPSHHSRSSSNSSHRDQLPEFTDVQLAQTSLSDASQVKRPIAVTKSLPRTDTASANDNPGFVRGSSKKRELRKTRSFGESSEGPNISKYDLVQAKRALRRRVPSEVSLAEEPEETNNEETNSRLDFAQGTLEKQNLPEAKLYSPTGYLLPQRHVSDPGSEERTGDVFAVSRGRSLSPARPQSLNLSKDVPRAPQFPHWKDLVRSPEKYTRANEDDGVVDELDMADIHDHPPGSSSGGNLAQSDVMLPPPSIPSSDDEIKEVIANRPDHTNRQTSSTSTSNLSFPSPTSPLNESSRSTISSKTSLSELNVGDVASLVQQHVLPPVAIPLKEELNLQWEEWEKDYDDAVTSEHVRAFLTPSPLSDSPESEVARRLIVIGDLVQEEYGELIEQAMEGVLRLPQDHLTYEVFIATLQRIERMATPAAGWKQVALLLLFGQRLVLGLLSRGSRNVGRLIDFTGRAINDRAARFIIDQGGWANIPDLELDLDSSSSGLKVELNNPLNGTSSEHSPQTISTSVSNDTVSSCDVRDGKPPSPTMPVATSSDNDPHSVGAASPSDDNNKNYSDDEKRKSPDPSPDSGCVTSSNHAPMSGQLTPEEQKSVDDAINNVRHEIQLIRQVSSDLRTELDLGNNRKPDSPTWGQTLVLTGALALLGVGLVVVYRRLKNR